MINLIDIEIILVIAIGGIIALVLDYYKKLDKDTIKVIDELARLKAEKCILQRKEIKK